MQLLATPGNPIPDGAEIIPVSTRDGVSLRAVAWPAAGQARGTVLILQGRAEFVEKYFETVDELRARGLAVVTFDWRGQGGSQRALLDPRRGHIRDFSDFRHDLEAVREQVLARLGPEPVHALAHSMGGCVALTAAGEGWLGADSLVALTPMVGLSLVRHPRLAQRVAGFLQRLGLGDQFVPGGRTISISMLPFENNVLCTDRARYDRNAAVAEALGGDAIGSPTIGWVVAAYEAMRRLEDPALAAAIDLPVLLVAAGDDPICSTPAITRLADRLRNGRLLVVPGARHEILHETDALRSSFWEAFDAFVSGSEARPRGEPAPLLALSR